MDRILLLMDMLGTLAFAVSGALVAVRRRMDIFGVVVLAIVTATGGGVLRDIVIGSLPPVSFMNPLYVGVAALTGLIVFMILYCYHPLPKKLSAVYNLLMFSFDTLGMAAFTVDGVAIGLDHGYQDNLFLLVFLGSVTGVGGGVIRDILADEMPHILRKHVYALATILGGLIYALIERAGQSGESGVIIGFSAVVILRSLAVHYQWNLPRVGGRDAKVMEVAQK